MNIKLIKPLQLGETTKPIGRVLEVTRLYGIKLIEDGFAEELDNRLNPVKKNVTNKTKK
jgi:hypothetical protein